MTIEGIHIQNLLTFASVQEFQEKDFVNTQAAKFPIDPQRYYPSEVFTSILHELFHKLQDPHLAYKLALNTQLKSLGLIYQISLLVTNVQEALQYLNQYLSKSYPLAEVMLFKAKNPNRVQLKVRSTIHDPLLSRLIEENMMLIMYMEILAMVRNPEGIILFSEYEQYWDSTQNIFVEKNDFTGLDFEAKLMAHSMDELQKLHLGSLLSVFLSQMEKKKSSGKESDLVQKVKTILLNMASPYLPNIEQVSRLLNKSTRTLQRELQAEATSFRQITNELKINSARLLLLNSALSIKDIAYLLGYSAPSAFLRHFKKVMDVSPLTFRKRKISS